MQKETVQVLSFSEVVLTRNRRHLDWVGHPRNACPTCSKPMLVTLGVPGRKRIYCNPAVGQNRKRKVIYVDDWMVVGIGVCDVDVLFDGLLYG
jgi:hypothetical protein